MPRYRSILARELLRSVAFLIEVSAGFVAAGALCLAVILPFDPRFNVATVLTAAVLCGIAATSLFVAANRMRRVARGIKFGQRVQRGFEVKLIGRRAERSGRP